MNFSDVEDLYEGMRNDPEFLWLRRGKNPLVPGEGQQPTKVFIVGEAPGADEVMALRPFVGASGKVLRQLMAIANLFTTPVPQAGYLANCWLTNAVKYRPPRNRTPTLPEIKASRPYLDREWYLVGQPPVIIAVGATALTAIRREQSAIGQYAGKPITNTHGRTLWPMFHPAYGLRGNDTVKGVIEEHWNRLAEWLDENGSR